MQVLENTLRLTVLEFFAPHIPKLGAKRLFGDIPQFYDKTPTNSDYNKFSRQKNTLLLKHGLTYFEVPLDWYMKTSRTGLLFNGCGKDFRFITNWVYAVLHKRDAKLAPLRAKMHEVAQDFISDLEQFEHIGMKLVKTGLEDL